MIASLENLAVRVGARHLGQHLVKVPPKHRILAAATLAALGLGLWWLTKNENWLKLFEFSSAPFVDKVVFAVVEAGKEAA